MPNPNDRRFKKPWYKRKPWKGKSGSRDQGEQSGGNQGSEKANGKSDLGGKWEVMVDYTAMKLADWLVRFLFNILDVISPELSKKLNYAVRKYRVPTEGAILVILQGVGNLITPFMPGKFAGTFKDILARVPAAFSLIALEIEKKPMPSGVQISEGDITKLQEDVISKIKNVFEQKTGLARGILKLIERGAQDKEDYLKNLVSALPKLSRQARDVIQQLLLTGDIDDLVVILESTKKIKDLSKALALLHKPGAGEIFVNWLKEIRGGNVTANTAEKIKEIYQPLRKKLGLPSSEPGPSLPVKV